MLWTAPTTPGVGIPLVTGVAAFQSDSLAMFVVLYRTRYALTGPEAALPASWEGAVQLKLILPPTVPVIAVSEPTTEGGNGMEVGVFVGVLVGAT
jgi:hypothetical protein